MKSINTLRDLGRKRTCVIIGGGHSINDIDVTKIPENTYKICINNHFNQHADMIIYYDKDMQEYYKDFAILPHQLLLGFKHSDKLDHTNDKCTHFYNYSDMLFGDSGFHALQFANTIFRFETIYLAGFDYKVKNNSYHYNEIESDKNKMDLFIKWSIGKILDKYNIIKWDKKIYNCNKNSDLKLFDYGLPY